MSVILPNPPTSQRSIAKILMKKKIFLRPVTRGLKNVLLFTACLGLVMSTLAMTGCGSNGPDESSLDRIPNVPPPSQSNGKSFIPSKATAQ